MLHSNKRLRELGWEMVLQIHDEIVLEGPKVHLEEARKTITFLRKEAEECHLVTACILNVIKKHTGKIVLMQCNTNYTGDLENIKYSNLNVINKFKKKFPKVVLGLSDHTFGHVTVLGAVMLGARVIEKHFTDDTSRKGPDHPFSMDPSSWRKMVDDTRLLESAMGSSLKKVEENEKETVILQRRAIRLLVDKEIGDIINKEDIQFQRPCPENAVSVNDIDQIIGKKLLRKKDNGDCIRKEDIIW